MRRGECLQPLPAPINPKEIHQDSNVIYGVGHHRRNQIPGPNPQQPQIRADEGCDNGVGPGDQMECPKQQRSHNQRHAHTNMIRQTSLNFSTKECTANPYKPPDVCSLPQPDVEGRRAELGEPNPSEGCRAGGSHVDALQLIGRIGVASKIRPRSRSPWTVYWSCSQWSGMLLTSMAPIW